MHDASSFYVVSEKNKKFSIFTGRVGIYKAAGDKHEIV